MRKKISFILGILNAERTLRECLNGILMQDYLKSNYEIIIVDGGSSDKTLEIIKEYKQKNKNIILLHNPKKLSEGIGMSKDIGIKHSRAEFVVLLDHDNIILDRNWLNKMLFPFFKDKQIVASQSLLKFKNDSPIFLKYLNRIGIEDPFAIPYSLVSQVSLNPKRFEKVEENYYVHTLNSQMVLFAGANGCIFRRSLFNKINYSRDVDLFAEMAEYKMKIAIPINAYLFHDTSSGIYSLLKKKAIYCFRFLNKDSMTKKFNWIRPGSKGRLAFIGHVLYSLSIILPLFYSFRRFIKEKEFFWFIHPFLLFLMTSEYFVLSLFSIKKFFIYARSR
jgi:glycosyltransferase involved in cell wall biosynthesis